MELNEALAFIHATDWKGSRLGLERMRELMHRLGNPQDSLKFIHVAGTNGKGSTSTMLASILTAAGYKTGLYTSPHLVRVNERFRINGADIPDAALCRAAEAVKEAADGMSDAPTEFEILTAMGFRHFAAEKCDAVVLEVGLGGRLDATNVIPSPEAAVITNIGLEHTAILGHTLPEIAREKAGIIKPGTTAVTYPVNAAVDAVYREICAERGAVWRGAAFDTLQERAHSLAGQRFDYKDEKDLTLHLLGEHQLRNAALAIETVSVLREKGWNIPESALREGFPRRAGKRGSSCCAPIRLSLPTARTTRSALKRSRTVWTCICRGGRSSFCSACSRTRTMRRCLPGCCRTGRSLSA